MDTEQFRGLWTTRPVRPAAGRTVAGVCTGIGYRYRVDPTLVKIAFVVATLFGGSGVFVYIGLWIVLPSGPARGADADALRKWWAEHPHLAPENWREAHSHLRMPSLRGLERHGLGGAQVLGLIVLAIIAITSFGPKSVWSSSGIVGVALLALGWWLLHQRTPVGPDGTSADTIAAAEVAAPPADEESAPPAAPATVSLAKGSPDATGSISDGSPEAAPPAWDPLGTARFAWDLPEPPTLAPASSSAPGPAPVRSRRSAVTLITFGTAVLVATGATAASLSGVAWFTPQRIVAATLAVIGAGLVIGGLRKTTGRHAPGLTFWALLGAAGVVVLGTAGGLGSLPDGDYGQRDWKPAGERDVAAEYTLRAGSLNLDLRSVTLTADRSVEVRNGIGEIRIQVPASMAVVADCSTKLGDVSCAGRSGPADAPVLHLNARTTVGEVELIRD